MNLLLIGSGGREHALAWKIAQSPDLSSLYIAPGSDAMAGLGTLTDLDVTDHSAVVSFAKEKDIALVVVGPEAPLVDGLADTLKANSIAVFGPDKYAAQLEGSKDFTKQIADKAGVPTAAYKSFTDPEAAKAYISEQGAPIVVKADGLAAGKGVVVATTIAEAHHAVDELTGSAAGATLVIEECLTGPEVSAFYITDGDCVLPIGTAQDHKRAYDGDTGPNTGGMGAFSPALDITPAEEEVVINTIVRPTLAALKAAGHPYCGILYAGLMMTPDGPKLIEYNCRFGDPECQVLMQRLDTDIVKLMYSAAMGILSDRTITLSADAATTIVMASKGYPGTYEKGTRIEGIEAASADNNITIFHAGTKKDDRGWQAVGGRVLSVTAVGDTVADAAERAYKAVHKIDWPGGFYRTDIAAKARKQ